MTNFQFLKIALSGIEKLEVYVPDDQKDDDYEETLNQAKADITTLMGEELYGEDVAVVDESDYEDETEKLNEALKLLIDVEFLSEDSSDKDIENAKKAVDILNDIIHNRR